jgi:Icc-related predicted phosphoesterase
MTFGVIADVHGNFEALRTAMTRHPEVPFWLCVGDLASRSGTYPEPPAPLYWIKGNNEDFDAVEAFARGERRVPNLHYIPNGHVVRAGSLVVAGLGGTFAPRWYDTEPTQLPHPGRPAVGVRDDKRRHFVHREVDTLKRLRGVDVFLTHEAPRPFHVEPDWAPAGNRRRLDAGKTPINEVLAIMRPRLHLCGHHHRFVDRVSRSYLLVESETMAYHKLDQPGQS